MNPIKNERQRAETAGSPDPRDKLVRTLGASDSTLLVVSSVIGAGIFFTPGVVAANIPHPGWFLLAWAIGGGLSVAGALANAEMGAMFPRAGGNYVYLREAFHPMAGFLVGWLSFFVIFAGTIATLAAAFSNGIGELTGLGIGGQITISILVVILTTWANYIGLRSGAAFNNVTAILKIFGIGLLVAIGLGLVLPSAAQSSEPLNPVRPSGFALAMSPILFSYLGWNAPVYVASEIRNPGRSLPIALVGGLLICTALYLLVNFLYLSALPMSDFAGPTNVGELTARALFGEIGGDIAAILILLSILGCLNATILVGPRIAYAMALDGQFFPGAERVHSRRRTPHIALLTQALVAIFLIAILRSFPSILDYTTFAIVLATMADILALYALRRKRPEADRPYRAWGYPWMPALYFLANAAIAGALLLGRPWEAAIAVLVTISGLPFLWVFSRRSPQDA